MANFYGPFETKLDTIDLGDMVGDIQRTMLDWQNIILSQVGKDVVRYLRSYTSRKNPPRYPRRKYTYVDSVRTKLTKKQQKELQPDRPAHPGGWSDVTGPMEKDSLAASYYWRVGAVPGGIKLTIGNSSTHAAYVEAKDGYFVVTGIFAPNGPVMKAIRKYMKQYAPGTQVLNQLRYRDVGDQSESIVDTITTKSP